MPKLILRCNYLKNAPPSHLENFMTYIGTRDGVEKVESTIANLPPTARQEDLIQDILRKIPDAGRMHEYYDYLQRPTAVYTTSYGKVEISSGRWKPGRDFFVRAWPCSPLTSFSLIRKTELWRTNKPPAMRVVEIALALCKKPPLI